MNGVVGLLQVVKQCNDGAKKMQQTEQMCLLVNHFDFKVKVRHRYTNCVLYVGSLLYCGCLSFHYIP